jgi:DNA mismatch repair protein MutL
MANPQPLSQEPLRLHRLDLPPFKPFAMERPSSNYPPTMPGVDGLISQERSAEGQDGELTASPSNYSPPHKINHRNALQVHKRYLVVETDAGIEVIDQHALHERILYEQIRAKVLGGALEAQKLLVPEPVDLTANEAAAVLEHAELLAQLGVDWWKICLPAAESPKLVTCSMACCI